MQRLLLILLALCILTGTAGAITVEIQPDRVVDGDQVTVHLHDLPNGTVFSLKMDGEFAIHAGRRLLVLHQSSSRCRSPSTRGR